MRFERWHNGDWSQKNSRFNRDFALKVINFLEEHPAVFNNRQRRFCFDDELQFFSGNFLIYNVIYSHKFDCKPCLSIFSEENGYYSILIVDDNYAPVLIDNDRIAWNSSFGLILAVADYRIAGDSLVKNNRLTRMKPDILKNGLIDKIVQQYQRETSLSSASSALSSVVG